MHKGTHDEINSTVRQPWPDSYSTQPKPKIPVLSSGAYLLPEIALSLLKICACLGNNFNIDMIAKVHDKQEEAPGCNLAG